MVKKETGAGFGCEAVAVEEDLVVSNAVGSGGGESGDVVDEVRAVCGWCVPSPILSFFVKVSARCDVVVRVDEVGEERLDGVVPHPVGNEVLNDPCCSVSVKADEHVFVCVDVMG